MIAIEGDTVRCSECGQTYTTRVFAVGVCVRCGSRRLNSELIEPVRVPSVRQFNVSQTFARV
jgi:Zn finger protein HypA/HybF involved in hydrogenase expression